MDLNLSKKKTKKRKMVVMMEACVVCREQVLVQEAFLRTDTLLSQLAISTLMLGPISLCCFCRGLSLIKVIAHV